MRTLSRRTVLTGLATTTAALAMPSGIAAAASANPSYRFSRIAVDAGPLRAKGLGPFAEFVGAALATQLKLSFADRLEPGLRNGTGLVVRIDALSLSSNVPGGGGHNRSSRGGGNGGTDYMEGEGLVVDSRGGVIGRYPMLSALSAGYAGAWYLPDAERKRVAAIAWHYAYWMRREVVGR